MPCTICTMPAGAMPGFFSGSHVKALIWVFPSLERYPILPVFTAERTSARVAFELMAIPPSRLLKHHYTRTRPSPGNAPAPAESPRVCAGSKIGARATIRAPGCRRSKCRLREPSRDGRSCNRSPSRRRRSFPHRRAGQPTPARAEPDRCPRTSAAASAR